MRRKAVVFFQGACLFLATSSILVGFGHFAGHSILNTSDISPSLGNGGPSKKPDASAKPPLKDGNSTLLKLAPSYINAIMTPNDTSFPRLDCPSPAGSRYEYLRKEADGTKLKYFFALNLRKCAHVLPRLIGSIVETMHFLGPENCALSIVEGRSDDGTYEILKLLRTQIEGIGAHYYFDSNELNPTPIEDRIMILAELRNQALQPLTDNPDKYAENAIVIFLNDVAICMEDILELVHQRVFQDAEMVCGMDWTSVVSEPSFYDIWIARGMTGDSFFNIPGKSNWKEAGKLFWNDSESLERYNAHKPFQVYSCWNGGVVFTSKLLLEQKIKFRNNTMARCNQGEPHLFCKDIWHRGHGKIAVVPSINLEYSDKAARKIKDLKGYVSKWVNKDVDDPSIRIKWKSKPPAKVKCMTPLHNQTWLPWKYD